MGWCLLRLWPSRAARCFWGTTIRSSGNQVKLRLDAQDVVESGCQQFFAAALLHGVAGAVVIKTDGQQFAVVPYNLGIAVDGHPDQTGLIFQKLEHFGPGAAHHFNLGRLLDRLLCYWLLRYFRLRLAVLLLRGPLLWGLHGFRTLRLLRLLGL